MFTGIISDIGEVLEINDNGKLNFTIGCNYDINTISIGGSIAHDGVCLTVIEKGKKQERQWFRVDVSQETINCTKLKNSRNGWSVGSLINLERSLKMGDELGGHIVTGHVDGVAKITRIENIGESTKVRFLGPKELSKFIAKKGSVALNGTSLTVNESKGAEFEVNLIPHTKENTTWEFIQPNDYINIEIDPLARYVARLNELRA